MKETLAFYISALHRDFLSYTSRELKQLGLSFGQMPVILYIGKHAGCTQSDFTKALKLDWGYSQRSISKLADQGFLTKQYDAVKGGNCLELTEQGKQAFDVCHQVFDAWDQIKLDQFTEEEKKTIMTLLSKITA